jgi:hypothetical protein
MNHGLEPLMQFADVLLPGDDPFPAASESGMAEILLARLRDHPSSDLAQRVLAAVAAAGGPLASLTPPERAAVVARLEKSEPKLFDEIRKIIYITYYEQESVVAVIRALGIPYNVSPLPDGYPTEAFDAGRDAPRHCRGHWIATDHVTRVDLSGLSHLETGK